MIRSHRVAAAGRVAFVLVATFAVASCGLTADSSPRDVPLDEQRDLVNVATGNVDSAGDGRIYLEKSDETGRSYLVVVPRRIPLDPASVVRVLFAGPTDDEQRLGIRSAIPPSTEVRGARYLASDLVRLDLSDGIFDATGDDLVSAVAQIVLTLDEIEGIDRVVLSVDGTPRQWPRGDGTLTDEPLTAFDYPGRAISSQPPYPGLVERP